MGALIGANLHASKPVECNLEYFVNPKVNYIQKGKFPKVGKIKNISEHMYLLTEKKGEFTTEADYANFNFSESKDRYFLMISTPDRAVLSIAYIDKNNPKQLKVFDLAPNTWKNMLQHSNNYIKRILKQKCTQL